MAFDIFLIADADAGADQTAARLGSVLATHGAAALLVRAGDAGEAAYRDRVAALRPLAQAEGCALILDNRPDLVEDAEADGVHVTGGLKALREAIAALKPGFIVGTGDIGSRHEAMLRGEMDVDYLMFGDRADPEDDGHEMAQWWAETFEVPSVYVVKGNETPDPSALGCEFVAFAEAHWDRIGGTR